MAFVAAATLAVGGGTFWIATSAGSGDTTAPAVESVDEGQRYGSADAAERQLAPEGQRYGSADAAEHQTTPDAPAEEQQSPSGTDPRQLP
jgi:hypothetical protein